MNKNCFSLWLVVVLVLAGCVSVSVTKAKSISEREICIVDNPMVRSDFRDAYERQIQAKGYTTKIVNGTSSCQFTSTYAATYRWHWGVYLATADLRILNRGEVIGQAKYKAPYASPEKHGRVENKIEALVAELLP